MLLAVGPTAASSGQAAGCEGWSELIEIIRARGLDREEVEIPGCLTEEMKSWVEARVPRGTSPDAALRLLLAALIEPEGFRLTYDADYTGTAREVFASRRANCLAFTHLFVGMSRALGIPTYYVRWSLVERFRRQGDLVVVSGHVSAGYGSGGNRHVLEFGAVAGLATHSARPISDINAVARHYANRSAELTREGRVLEAVSTAEIATRLDPSLADGWVNLGVARRRAGELKEAELAYRRATLADPDHLAAYHNLSVVLELRGERDAARQVLALLDRRDNRNPFIYLMLGDDQLELGRVEEAGRFYRKARRLAPELAETLAAWGAWVLRQGDVEGASKWLRRARKVDPDERRTRELAVQISQRNDAKH